VQQLPNPAAAQLADDPEVRQFARLDSMAIVQLKPSPTEGSLAKGFAVPRNSVLRSAGVGRTGTTCEFRTAHAVELWPLRIVEARYHTQDLGALDLPPEAQTAALFKTPRHPYTEALLSAVPKPDPSRRTPPNILQGEVADPANIPAGFPFPPPLPPRPRPLPAGVSAPGRGPGKGEGHGYLLTRPPPRGGGRAPRRLRAAW